MSSIAVIIPAFKVRQHILPLIASIGPEVTAIYVVDDKCPDASGRYVEENSVDPRVCVLYHDENRGVGGAMITGYRRAIADDVDILVKLDGDGQMDPRLIRFFCGPIEKGLADYTKGNRFFAGKSLKGMPMIRLLGNGALSFLTKASSGYWDMLDPANGYTAIHARVAAALDLEQVSNRYFFESDMLFHLGKLRARVIDIPLMSQYADEESNLHVSRIWPEFLAKNVRNTMKRILYSYFIRGFSVATLSLIMALLLLATGTVAGLAVAINSNASGVPASTGAIVLIALLLVFGFQLLLTFLSYDISSSPSTAIHLLIADVPVTPLTQFAPPLHQQGQLGQE